MIRAKDENKKMRASFGALIFQEKYKENYGYCLNVDAYDKLIQMRFAFLCLFC